MSPSPRHLVLVVLGLGSTAVGPVFAQQFADRTNTRFPVQALYTNQLSFCDVDGDGDLDIAFADGQGYSSQGAPLRAKLYINDGTGHFADQSDVRIPVTGWFRGVEFGDVDGDGDPDMILANDFNKKPVLLINAGFGLYIDGSDALPDRTLSSARGQFADVDDDGDLDIAFCNSGTSNRFGSNGRPVLYLNDGTGTFTDVTETHTPNAIVRDQQDCLFFDADGDLDLDLHIGSRSTFDGGSQLWFNDGTGHFTRLESGLPGDFSTYSYDAGDVDGDGDLDLLGANSASSNRELLLLNDGDGRTWTDRSDRIITNPTSDDNDTKFIDWDMDGDLDIVVAALFSSTDRFYRNNGSGSWIQSSNMQSSIPKSSLDIGFADLDGDGAPDCVTACGESGNFQNRIYINQGPSDDLPPTFLGAPLVKAVDSDSGPFVVRVGIIDQVTSDRGFMPRSVEMVVAVEGKRPVVIPMDWAGNSIWRGVVDGLAACTAASVVVRVEDRAGNEATSESVVIETAGDCGPSGDLDGDGLVNGSDLGLLVSQWGGPGTADLDGDGEVTGSDLGLLMVQWTG